ncbi:MAG: small basic protein [Candidatus Omnitrophica bacterium]|nr:small basic protein [Candidatus Omnitrophota bacterium]
MSLHPSLTATKGKKHRSVHKRFERIQKLKKDGKWEEASSCFRLPKEKIVRMKLKKKKAEAKEGAEGTEQQAAATPPAATTSATTKTKPASK